MPKTLFRSAPPELIRRGASTPREWRDLCLKALTRARKVNDPRAVGLEKALEMKQEQRTLQALGIICEQDVDREF